MRPRCNAWPALLLVTALATVFPFLSEWGPLYRLGVGHDHITFNSLAVARNYSAEHGWRRFEALTVNDDGERAYLMYYRFPPLGNVSIKLAVSTQNGDWRGEVQAARLLMLAFYAGAAMLAYFSLVALTQRRWAALAATLTAFASGVALYTSDMVSSEGSVGLFSTMLAFHGICRYYGAKAGSTTPNATPRFGQMLAKTCVALLLGWHVLGLLAPFVGLGMAAAFAAKSPVSTLPRSSHLTTTTFMPASTALAGLVPWADDGIRQTLRRACPSALSRARITSRPASSP